MFLINMISVVIPVYNHAHTIRQCLESLAKQTFCPLEVVLVNDGSTDNFSEAVKDLKFDFDLKIINQENQGAPVARNHGFAQTSGELIIFWDADTIAHPQMLEKLARALTDNPKASFSYCQFKFGFKTIYSHEFDLELLRKVNYIDTTSLVRRADFCGFDESLKRFQDWDLWLTMTENGKTGVLVKEVLFKKIVGGREGISTWLPSWFYKFNLGLKRIQKYNTAKEVIFKKHHLS